MIQLGPRTTISLRVCRSTLPKSALGRGCRRVPCETEAGDVGDAHSGPWLRHGGGLGLHGQGGSSCSARSTARRHGVSRTRLPRPVGAHADWVAPPTPIAVSKRLVGATTSPYQRARGWPLSAVKGLCGYLREASRSRFKVSCRAAVEWRALLAFAFLEARAHCSLLEDRTLRTRSAIGQGVAIRARSLLQVRSAFSGEAYTAASLTAEGPPVQWTSRPSPTAIVSCSLQHSGATILACPAGPAHTSLPRLGDAESPAQLWDQVSRLL